jgi:two-component system, NtrC family, sensor kinase
MALQATRNADCHLGTFLLISGLGWLLLELLRRRWLELASKIHEVEEAQRQLLQSEKLASIGQLAAGVAHEINNPVGFVNSNLGSLRNYSQQMLALLEKCRHGQASEADFHAVDFDYLRSDVLELLQESQDGLGRVTRIVNDLKDFSRVDRTEEQDFDLNSGLESTLNVVWNELKYKAEVIRDYGEIPLLRCVGAQINQVAMNLLLNAAHAIADTARSHCAPGTMRIRCGSR